MIIFSIKLLIVWSIKCQQIVKNTHHIFPASKAGLNDFEQICNYDYF